MTNPAVLPEDDGEAWLILYEDADQKHELFSGCGSTDAAHSRFEQLSITWSCHLFRRVALTLPEPTPDPRETASEAHEQCSRCQGNGEIVRNWKRYKHPRDGDKGDEAVAECPDCDGTGAVPSPRAEAAEIAQIAADRAADRASAISFHEEADRLRDSLARANAERDRLNSENDALVKDMINLVGRTVDATARTDEAADEREATIARLSAELDAARDRFKCKARPSLPAGPQDCDWPQCGCDPAANRVLAHLQECGFTIVDEATIGVALTEAREALDGALAELRQFKEETLDEGAAVRPQTYEAMNAIHRVLAKLSKGE